MDFDLRQPPHPNFAKQVKTFVTLLSLGTVVFAIAIILFLGKT